MNKHVNFENLREITEGDVELEKELCQMFMTTAEEAIALLRNSCAVNDSAAWRRQAHALKGISLNLGAQPLGVLCYNAQLNSKMPQANKEDLLSLIESEYGEVKMILEQEKLRG